MVASTFINLCRFTSASTGTGTTVTVGSAVLGYATPAQAGATNGQTFSYACYDPSASGWETGTCVYTSSGATFVRTPITSSNSNAAINLSGSAQFVFTALAADLPNLKGDNTFLGIQTFNKAIGEAVVTLTDGATPALDASLGNVFRLAAAGDRTIAVPSNPQTGQKIIIQHFASAGARTLALNSGANGFRFGSDVTALTQTVSGKTDYIGCLWNVTDSKWDVIAYSKGY